MAASDAASERELERLRAELAARDADVASRDEVIATLTKQVSLLATEVAELKAKLAGRPPPSPPAKSASPTRRRKPKGRRRGGQKGHRGSHRELLDASEMDAVQDLFPPECGSCWRPFESPPSDPFARRYQHVEWTVGAVRRTEYRRHAVRCADCGYRTRAAYEGIPPSAFGPRLTALVVLLSGAYHLSRRQVVRLLWELLGVRMSLGTVSALEGRMSRTLAAPVEQAAAHVRDAPVKHADGTTWRERGAYRALWVLASALVTVFEVLPDGTRATLRERLFDGTPRGILVSDRASTLTFWAMGRRQVCWAHLLRKFVSFEERAGPHRHAARELAELAGLVFTYTHELEQGRVQRAVFEARIAAVRRAFEEALERVAKAGHPGLSGTCEDLLTHRAALWTFVGRDDVPPTNNHAEQQLRAFVLWRKRCYGAQSERGNRFAARLMSVVHTLRKQRRDVLGFLVEAARAALGDGRVPSLLPA